MTAYDWEDDAKGCYTQWVASEREKVLAELPGVKRARVIGRCELIEGDCLEVMPGLGKVDAVVTDPPYGINFAGQPTKWQRRAGTVAKDWDQSAPDCSPLLTAAPVIAIWGGNYFDLPISRGWLSWFKPDAPPSMASIELCWTNQDQNARQISQSISATNAERVGHPTQKPFRVMVWTMERLPFADTILDPFMGSGTTLVACAKLGRRGIGIELDPDYFDIAVKRVQDAYRQPDLFVSQPEPPKQEAMDL